ncbi:putative aminoacyltransferase, E1 ubiquitin-activating enzyme [Rosa chinensis]|uniref:Putative aminoacyltransferase, E1 ubiquitin-activating enzyme n=1 Tax=Rosa chinensis TaxID=74649 RepID=A0A2P6QNF4_ROSCH|nr:putative aminoacyltransferase, E1 ubiquitin-activating enzyme [Rosa chinensis]
MFLFLGTPYQGGIYFLDITFPGDYPFKPPKILFRTRVFHCNVDSSGNVSLEIVKDGWSPALTITKVLLAIRSIFTKPDPCKFYYPLSILRSLLFCLFLCSFPYVSSLSPLFYSWYSSSLLLVLNVSIFKQLILVLNIIK